ncbi:MAG: hypothetical protein QM784_35345 [Polyangiaceae bacterium]
MLVHELGHVFGFTHDHANCDSALIAPAGYAGVCGAPTSDYNISARDTWLATSTYSSATYHAGVFLGAADGGSYIDWNPYYYTGTVSPGYAMVGLSSVYPPDRYAYSFLSFPGLKGEFSGTEATVLVNAGADVKRGTRLTNWDMTQPEFECGLNEYVSGLSQTTAAPNQIHGVRCSPTTVSGGFTANCELRMVAGGTSDYRGMTYSGDWAPNRYKAECAAGKVIVGLSVFGSSSSATQGRPHYILCCGSNSRPSIAYDFEQRDGGFMDGYGWDGSYNEARCMPGYGMTGLSQYSNIASSHLLCSPSTKGEFREDASTTMVQLPSADYRRATRAGDWDPGYTKTECALNEYVTAVSQSTTYPEQMHAIRCTTGQFTNSGSNNCEVRDVADRDDRGNTSTGDWSWGRHKGECSAGKVVVGISSYPSAFVEVSRRLLPRRILCCDR